MSIGYKPDFDSNITSNYKNELLGQLGVHVIYLCKLTQSISLIPLYSLDAGKATGFRTKIASVKGVQNRAKK